MSAAASKSFKWIPVLMLWMRGRFPLRVIKDLSSNGERPQPRRRDDSSTSAFRSRTVCRRTRSKSSSSRHSIWPIRAPLRRRHRADGYDAGGVADPLAVPNASGGRSSVTVSRLFIDFYNKIVRAHNSSPVWRFGVAFASSQRSKNFIIRIVYVIFAMDYEPKSVICCRNCQS